MPKLNIYQMLSPDLWNNITFLMKEVSPFVMISFAIAVVGILIPIITKIFKKAEKEMDTDFDYDYIEY